MKNEIAITEIRFRGIRLVKQTEQKFRRIRDCLQEKQIKVKYSDLPSIHSFKNSQRMIDKQKANTRFFFCELSRWELDKNKMVGNRTIEQILSKKGWS